MLAVESNPTLIQQLLPRLFQGEAGAIVGVAWSVVLVLGVFLPFVSVFAMLAIWMERKVSATMQSRIGPNRVGPFGLLQSLADGIKLILKEDLIPGNADQLLFRLAPYLAFVPVFAAFLVLPFGPEWTFESRISSGLFWILAVLSLEVMGVILAGWASNNKWAIYGAMREACQVVSYEIPLGMSVIVAVMAAGTLNLVELGHLQSGGMHTWLIFRNPFTLIAFFVYFVASLASNKRSPFDLPESESELVSGFHTEYSGLRFSFFFFAEYAGMFVVGGIQTALFLGGWNDPFGLIGLYHQKWTESNNAVALMGLNAVAAGVFILKAMVIVFVQMWMRWSLPRPRIDQVLYVCVKVLMPIASVLLLGAAIWPLLVPDSHPLPWHGFNPFRYGDWARNGAVGALVTQTFLTLVGVAAMGAVVVWVVMAWLNRNSVSPRLSHAEPIQEGE